MTFVRFPFRGSESFAVRLTGHIGSVAEIGGGLYECVSANRKDSQYKGEVVGDVVFSLVIDRLSRLRFPRDLLEDLLACSTRASKESTAA